MTSIPRKQPISATHPHLIPEIHPSLNGDLQVAELTHGSSKKAWWVCKKKHDPWLSPIHRRTRKGKESCCPSCSGHRLTVGENDLASQYPELVPEYSEKNLLGPHEIFAQSNWKRWWSCPECSYEYESVVSNRTVGEQGCPACSGNVCVPDLNDVATTDPWVVAEWSKKNKLRPTEVSRGSTRKIIWDCPNGTPELPHEYPSSLDSRTIRGTGCSICAGQRILRGDNDLETQNPDVAAEWSDRNVCGPHEITSGSGIKRWWMCPDCGYEYLASPDRRVGRGDGCIACSGHLLVRGLNDVATTDPWVLKEWSPDNDKTPYEVTRGSQYRAVWICPQNSEHRWPAAVASRTGPRKTGCSRHSNRISKAEVVLLEYVKFLLPGVEVVHSDRSVIRRIKPLELDIYVPSLAAAVEFNGRRWHSLEFRPEGHREEKTDLCVAKGVRLLHIEEDDWLADPDLVRARIREFLGITS